LATINKPKVADKG